MLQSEPPVCPSLIIKLSDTGNLFLLTLFLSGTVELLKYWSWEITIHGKIHSICRPQYAELNTNMVLIVDGHSKHVSHVWRSSVLFWRLFIIWSCRRCKLCVTQLEYPNLLRACVPYSNLPSYNIGTMNTNEIKRLKITILA